GADRVRRHAGPRQPLGETDGEVHDRRLGGPVGSKCRRRCGGKAAADLDEPPPPPLLHLRQKVSDNADNQVVSPPGPPGLPGTALTWMINSLNRATPVPASTSPV